MNIQISTKKLETAGLPDLQDISVAIIGLGYVGLPLAIAFGKSRKTVGFDLNNRRVQQLQLGIDTTGEVEPQDIQLSKKLTFTNDLKRISSCNTFIVAVPTPIDDNKQPEMKPLISAAEDISKIIKRGDVVIFESTVFPGATEEVCIPIIEEKSGLIYNIDFFVGYSPERINPGDKDRPLSSIVKVTSGSTPETADLVDALYRTIISAGTFKAESIKVAEASKIIENVQRDVNIALVNEFSNIFQHMDIDTSAVLDAAASKWNFSRLSPGLVGGHCIGVDPYYLIHKSSAKGFIPNIIRTARETNEAMVDQVCHRLVKKMAEKGAKIHNGRVLILGATFKENCPDIRNSKSFDLVRSVRKNGFLPDLHDPIADKAEVAKKLDIEMLADIPDRSYDAILLAVPHQEYVSMGAQKISEKLAVNGVFFDLKSAFAKKDSDIRI